MMRIRMRKFKDMITTEPKMDSLTKVRRTRSLDTKPPGIQSSHCTNMSHPRHTRGPFILSEYQHRRNPTSVQLATGIVGRLHPTNGREKCGQLTCKPAHSVGWEV